MPARVVPDPIRGVDAYLVFEVLNPADNTPHATNTRAKLAHLWNQQQAKSHGLVSSKSTPCSKVLRLSVSQRATFPWTSRPLLLRRRR